MISGILENEFDDLSIIGDIDRAIAEWSDQNLVGALDALGNILEDDDKDKIDGEKGNDVYFGGNHDKKKERRQSS